MDKIDPLAPEEGFEARNSSLVERPFPAPPPVWEDGDVLRAFGHAAQILSIAARQHAGQIKATSIDGRQHVQETALRTEQVVGHGMADDHHMRLRSASG
jgi:hypothetical protein